MLKMKTLTIGDKTYELWDPEAARVEDTAVGENPWSSRKLVEAFCPQVTTGKNTFCPVEGSPLQVQTRLGFTQTGSGDAGLDNIRPITGMTQLHAVLENREQRRELVFPLGQEAYCGSVDWHTGLLTLTHKMLTLTGEESGWVSYGTESILNHNYFADAVTGTSSIFGWCSHVMTQKDGALSWNVLKKANVSKGFEVKSSVWGLPDNAVAGWKDFLNRQAAAGTPLQVLYQLEQPLVLQLTPVEVTALAGQNTISCDAGQTSVTYFADPKVLLEQLCIE